MSRLKLSDGCRLIHVSGYTAKSPEFQRNSGLIYRVMKEGGGGSQELPSLSGSGFALFPCPSYEFSNDLWIQAAAALIDNTNCVHTPASEQIPSVKRSLTILIAPLWSPERSYEFILELKRGRENH